MSTTRPVYDVASQTYVAPTVAPTVEHDELVCVVAIVSTIGPDGWSGYTDLPRFYVERKGNGWDAVARDVHSIIARGERFDVAHLGLSTPTETAARTIDLAGNVA